MRFVVALVALVALIGLVACGARPHVASAGDGDLVTLYRDGAVIRQRVVVDVRGASADVTVRIAAGTPTEQVVVLDAGGLTVDSIRGELDPSAERTIGEPQAVAIDELDEDIDDPLGTEESPPPVQEPRPREPVQATAKPTELQLRVSAPRPGRYVLQLGYTTERITWHAAYTVLAASRRDRGVLRGAVSIHNTTGVVVRAAAARLVDAELGTWRGKSAEQLSRALAGESESGASSLRPRVLGALELGSGHTRVELLAPTERPLRSVLVYDPVGAKLDNRSPQPLRDPRLGIELETTSRVTESIEISRDRSAMAGLPAGPVRVIERRADGTLALLGEARMFDGSEAEVDTVPIGTADGVTGTRERRELTVDDENRRIVEEFVITIDNRRTRPATVLVREHLYRGQNWHLAYHSAPVAAKEGPQQIALRVEVPARGTLKILYVVVYTWPS